ncbi:MAG: hypothetical protein FJY82_12190 [Candidatus Aminicenantes bacterium]|nr:hypothetical protein [Candidatus Aminicenantes bacterium]
MRALKRWTLCKILAMFLCSFFALEAHILYARQAAAVSEQMAGQFKSAREAYFAQNYEGAKTLLEPLLEELETVEGQETFKGQAYLLAGAAYEKLEVFELAVMYFCRAKSILGEGKTIEGLELKRLKYYPANCAAVTAIFASGIVVAGDPYLSAYNRAKIAYFAAAFGIAQTILEKLIADLGLVEGREVFKGQVYLLAGATYEAQKFKELAVKYYCRAKAILGEGKTIEGLELKKLKYYGESCGGAVAGAVVPARRRSFLGGLLGTLLGLAILGGVVWYLFINKNSPLKKKESETKFTSACFSTMWTFTINSTWSGSLGEVTLSPNVNAGNYPKPNENNNWEDQVTYTLTTSGGGTLVSLELKIDLEVGGGDNGRRKDIVTVDGAEKLNVTNTFTESCNSPGKKSYANIYSRTSTGTFTLKHKVELSKAAAIGTAGEVIIR